MKRRHFLQVLSALPLMGGLFGTLKAQEGMGAAHDMGMSGENKRNIAVLFYDMALMFDYGPAAEIFRVAGGNSIFNVYSVSHTREGNSAMFPPKIYADYLFEDAPTPEVIIIPGGLWSEIMKRNDYFDWLRSCQQKGTILFSICTGGYILATGGFLDGIKVAGLQSQLELLEQLAPKAKVQKGLPFVDSGNIVTAAGAATSLDAALHLVWRLTDYDTARWIAQDYLDHFDWDQEFRGKPG